MSLPSAVDHAQGLDWNVIAAAVAVFIGTLVTTVLGALKARDELKKKLLTKEDGTSGITGAILQDNQTVREATLVSREVRDQLLLVGHALKDQTSALEENTRTGRDLLHELRHMRDSIDSFGKEE